MGRIQERDIGLLRFCFEQKFLTRKQIKEWVVQVSGLKESESVDRIVRRLVGRSVCMGVARVLAHRFGPCELVMVTNEGIRLLMDHGQAPESAKFADVDQLTVNHDTTVTDIRLLCKRHGLFDQWHPERIGRSVESPAIPDAVVEYFSPKLAQKVPIAIEIELTQKSKDRLCDVFAAYTTSPYQMTLYFMGNEAILARYIEVAKPINHRIYFCTISQFSSQGLESCWQNAHDSFLTRHFKKGGQK